MKNKNRNLDKIRKVIVTTLRKYGIKRAGIFGSYVRGEQKKGSDIDILIEPPRGMSLVGFVHLKYELERKLHKKIDLISYRGIHPLLKKQILLEEEKIIWKEA